MTVVFPFVGRSRFDEVFSVKGKAVDNNSLLRIGRNERLDNFRDFEVLLSYPLDRFNTNPAFHPAVFSVPVAQFSIYLAQLKPEHIYSTEGQQIFVPYRYAASTFATRELIDSQGENGIRAHLEYYVEVLEAIILHHFLWLYSFDITGMPTLPVDMRDIYSRLTTGILDLEPGTENVYYQVPSVLLYPTMYSPATETNVGIFSAGTQWFQTESLLGVRQRIVKIAFDYQSVLPSRTTILAYSDWLVQSFKRYYLDVFDISRVADRLDERNTYRITFERYSFFNFPLIRQQLGNTGPLPLIAPVVSVSAVFVPNFLRPYERPLNFANADIINILDRVS